MALRRFSAGRLPLLLFLCCALFVVQLGLALPELPSTKLMQDIICKRVMHLGGVRGLLPEDECHGEDVQRELNMVGVGVSISLTVAGKPHFPGIGETHHYIGAPADSPQQ